MKRSPLAIICTSLLIIAATTVCLTSNGTKAEAATLTRAEVNRQIDAILAQFGPIESMSGDMHFCALNDEHFDTLEGGCMDLATELVWGISSSPNWPFWYAEQAVEDSVEGGFTDWRLPTRTELETVVANDGVSHFQEGFAYYYWSSTKQGQKRWVVNITTGESLLAWAGGPAESYARFVGVREADLGGGGACNNNGICDPGEDCETCDDCEGKTNGPPSGRFCCGNGVAEGPEGDGTICDGNY